MLTVGQPQPRFVLLQIRDVLHRVVAIAWSATTAIFAGCCTDDLGGQGSPLLTIGAPNGAPISCRVGWLVPPLAGRGQKRIPHPPSVGQRYPAALSRHGRVAQFVRDRHSRFVVDFARKARGPSGREAEMAAVAGCVARL